MVLRHVILTAALVLGIAGGAAAQGVEILHRFGPPPFNISAPTSLMQASSGYFYGTTLFGGTQGPGAVFEMTPQGVMTGRAWLIQAATLPVEARSGTAMYVSGSSIQHGGPGVFRLRANSEFEPVHVFSFDEGVPGSVVEGWDGHLYGPGGGGVEKPHGAIFRLTIGGDVTWLHTFDGTDGARPGPMIQAADGNFYGTAFEGGSSGVGTLFRLTPDGIFTVLHHFAGGANDGAVPVGTLVQGLDGDLYGTTREGGPQNLGTVFRRKADGTVSVIYAFTGGVDGGSPSGLLRTSFGRYCGSTFAGTIYCVTPAGAFSLLHTMNPAEEGMSATPLVHGFDGYFYAGGFSAFTGGTIFRMRDPSPCDSAVALLYRGGVLDIRVTLRSELPAFTGAWLVHGSTVSPLWSTLIPAITPAALLHVPIWPLPAIGPLGVYTLVVTSSNNVCADWQTINTGGIAKK